MDHLIPQAWFDSLPQGWLLLVVVLSTGVLGKGADWLVDGASGLAYRMGMPKVIVGATIVSLGTTSPECAVSVMAAWQGQPGLALGNAVGSIVADSALIFGVGCLVTALPADRFVLSRQGWVQFGSGLLLAALCYGVYAIWGDQAVLGRWIGVLLLGLLAGYMMISIRWSRQHPHGEPFLTPDDMAKVKPPSHDPGHQNLPAAGLLMAALLLGLLLVILSSRVLICSVTVLAGHWGVPQVVIAATIVALGTSLPELVVGLTSVVKGHAELLVGNVIGADILNVLFVVGASAAAAQLPVVENGDPIFLTMHLPTMLVILLLFRLFVFLATKKGHFSRWMGVPLLALYIGYVMAQFLMS